jgi:hypothetical protein
MFLVYGGKFLSRKTVPNWVTSVSPMTKRLKRTCRSGWDNSQKTSMLRVSTHWKSDGTSVSMLGEDMSRNKCFFFSGSNVTCFTFYIRLWPIYWLSLIVQYPSFKKLKFLKWFSSCYMRRGGWTDRQDKYNMRIFATFRCESTKLWLI